MTIARGIETPMSLTRSLQPGEDARRTEPHPPRLVSRGRSSAPAVDRPRPRPVDLTAWLAASPGPDLRVPLVPAPPAGGGPAGGGRRVALIGGTAHRDHPDLQRADVITWPGGRYLPPDPVSTAHASVLVGQGVVHARGVVPAATLLMAAVGSPEAAGADLQIARAVRWAVVGGADVVVLPFGRLRLGRRLTTTLHAAMAEGVQVFAAAGDLGPEALAFPASITGVVAVTAHDGSRLLPQCSERADLAAPGIDVPGAGLRTHARLQGSAVAAVLAAGSHVAWSSRSEYASAR
jgi:hypothetical protein